MCSSDLAAIKAPGFGDRKKEILQDIATLTGATFITEEAGILLKDAGVDSLGSCESITVSKDKTTLVGGQGSSSAIKERVQQIESNIQNTTSSYDKEKLEERRAKLLGGVAVIRVGAPTEPEMKQKKQLFEDSLNSTRAATQQGVVLGGGITLIQASKALSLEGLTNEEKLGVNIVLKACESPFRQIVANTGLDPSVLLEQVRDKKNLGFNALTEQVEDLLKAGIIDPAKVVKNALLFASSTAGIILLSEALIGEAPEEE